MALAACSQVAGELPASQAASDLQATLRAGSCAKLYTVGDVRVLDHASVTLPGDTSPATKVEAEVTLSRTPALTHMGMFDDCFAAVSLGDLAALKPLANVPTTTAHIQGYWRKWQSGWRLEHWAFEN